MSEALDIGRHQFVKAVGGQTDLLTRQLIKNTGIYALTWFIQEVLDEHYPADIFGDGEALFPSWTGEHGGSDLDRGIKWVALLRHAIAEVDDCD